MPGLGQALRSPLPHRTTRLKPGPRHYEEKLKCLAQKQDRDFFPKMTKKD